MRTRKYMATVATAGLLAFPAMAAADTETMETQEGTGAQTEMESGQDTTGTQDQTGAQTDMDADHDADERAETERDTEMDADERAETERDTEMETDERAEMDREGEFLTRAPERSFELDELTGYTVLGEGDEEIASIEDVLVNEEGEIEALVLSTGGFLGMGEKTVAVEWDAVDVHADQEEIRTQFTQEDIENAPDYEGRDNNGVMAD